MNRNRTLLIAILFAITLLAVWTFYKIRTQAPSLQTVVAVRKNLKQLADRNREHLSSALTKTSELSKNKSDSKGILEIHNTFKVLHEQRELFNIESLREEIFAELKHNKEFISKVETTITDHTKAVEWFGEGQAMVRVLSIEFLAYLHRNGVEDPLNNSIHGMLTNLKNSGKETYKGQVLDIEDLIMHWSSNLGKQSIASSNPSSLETLISSLAEDLKIEELEFKSKSEVDLIRTIGRGIALGLKRDYPWEELSPALKRQFPNTFRSKT